MIQTLIVEDEIHAIDNLVAMLNELTDDIKVVHTAGTISQTVEYLQQHSPDLIFMDINLSDGSSFMIFDQVEVNCPVIFVTAYDQFAIKAFKVNGIDYLLKPVEKQELSASLERFRKLHSRYAFDASSLQSLIKDLKAERKFTSRFLIQYADKLLSVQTNKISYFFSLGKNTYLTSNKGQQFPVDYSLDALEDMLDPDVFFRVNRKYLVSYEAIESIIQYSKNRLKLILKPEADEIVTVSLKRMSAFKAWLER